MNPGRLPDLLATLRWLPLGDSNPFANGAVTSTGVYSAIWA